MGWDAFSSAVNHWNGDCKIKVSTKFRNWMIKEFERMGCLTHSSRMDTVGYIIRHCEDNNIPYLLTCPFGMGFIKRL